MKTASPGIALVLIAACTLATCGKPETPTRSGKLLTMAGEESAFISNLSDRLTRQLNIADLQIQTGQKSEALKTLALAADTLNFKEPATQPEAKPKESSPTLDDFGRIAGWTSVAELSRLAGNDKTATDAYMNAVEALHSVQPEVTRAQYVLSLSQVAHQLRGKEEAGQLLVKGGQWASKISDTNTRRFPLTSFAGALVSYDHLEASRTVMRNEPDPAWRADTFAAFASSMQVQDRAALESKNVAAARAPMTEAGSSYAKEASPGGFNKDVRYNARYRQTQLQQGLAPNATDPTH